MHMTSDNTRDPIESGGPERLLQRPIKSYKRCVVTANTKDGTVADIEVSFTFCAQLFNLLEVVCEQLYLLPCILGLFFIKVSVLPHRHYERSIHGSFRASLRCNHVMVYPATERIDLTVVHHKKLFVLKPDIVRREFTKTNILFRRINIMGELLKLD